MGFPRELTGFAVASEKAAVAEPQNLETINLSPATSDSAELKQCRDDIALCQNSVLGLKDIVLRQCEKPHHDFEAAAWEVARSREYSEAYDCDQFSEALYQKLKDIGYMSRIVQGTYKGEQHTWVVIEIPIEATSGNLITPQQYADYVCEKG
jgi:hypothetical protein